MKGPAPHSPLSVNNNSLERVTSYKYLGVWLTSTLNWSIQVSEVCSRARRQIGFIYRKFYGHANSSTLLQLYLTYVRPLLEYAAPVWDPHHQGLIDSLERVQKFALKLCLRDWNAGYNSLLQSCNLPTLTHRRQHLKLCFLFQVIHGQFNFPGAPIFPRNLAHNLRISGPFLLQRPPFITSAHQFSFFPHTITHWNSLPPSIHCCTTLYTFKHNLSLLSYL